MPAPTWLTDQLPADQDPFRLSWPSVAVAWVLITTPLLLANPCAVKDRSGEVANGPARTVAGQPAVRTVPIRVQCFPSAES